MSFVRGRPCSTISLPATSDSQLSAITSDGVRTSRTPMKLVRRRIRSAFSSQICLVRASTPLSSLRARLSLRGRRHPGKPRNLADWGVHTRRRSRPPRVDNGFDAARHERYVRARPRCSAVPRRWLRPRSRGPSEVEPTAVAAIALEDSAARAWLARAQRPDGGFAARDGRPESPSVAALAALAMGDEAMAFNSPAVLVIAIGLVGVVLFGLFPASIMDFVSTISTSTGFVAP